MYRNGQRQYTITLSKKEMQALSHLTEVVSVNNVGWREGARSARKVIDAYLNGPPDDMLDKLQEAIEEWACERGGGKFNARDSVRFHFDHMAFVLTVNPDGDVDDDTGRLVDCTNVTASWLVDGQSVDFELDSAMDDIVLDEWREQDQYVRRGV